MTEVFTIHTVYFELFGKYLDFTFEVFGGKASFAEGTGQSVGGCYEFDARICEFAHQAGHEDGIAGVVKLEFVNADELVPTERFYGFAEGEGTNQVGVFDEGTEGFGSVNIVP